jgi:DNA-binding PadR family transcriptional regulator
MVELDVDDLISDFARFYILTILYEGPTHGYGIIRKFKSRVGKKISPGLVYPFLQRLEERGLASQNSEMVGEKERKVHYLTEDGTALCNRLFQRFANLVSVGGHRQAVNREELVFCCSHCAASYVREISE